MRRALLLLLVFALIGWAAYSAFTFSASQLQHSIHAQAKVLESIEKGQP